MRSSARLKHSKRFDSFLGTQRHRLARQATDPMARPPGPLAQFFGVHPLVAANRGSQKRKRARRCGVCSGARWKRSGCQEYWDAGRGAGRSWCPFFSSHNWPLLAPVWPHLGISRVDFQKGTWAVCWLRFPPPGWLLPSRAFAGLVCLHQSPFVRFFIRKMLKDDPPLESERELLDRLKVR